MKTWRARNLNLQSFDHEFSHRLRFSEFTDGIYKFSIPSTALMMRRESKPLQVSFEKIAILKI